MFFKKNKHFIKLENNHFNMFSNYCLVWNESRMICSKKLWILWLYYTGIKRKSIISSPLWKHFCVSGNVNLKALYLYLRYICTWLPLKSSRTLPAFNPLSFSPFQAPFSLGASSSLMCVILYLCQGRVHAGGIRGTGSPFPSFRCSCPLNMSDDLERGITSGAEREDCSLSSPSLLYITFSDTKPDPFFLHLCTYVFISLSVSAVNFFLIFSKYLYTHLLCLSSTIWFLFCSVVFS